MFIIQKRINPNKKGMMIYIIAELFEFIEKVITDLDEAKQSPIYKILFNITNYSVYGNVAIPTFVLFHENVNYVEIIKNDFVKYNPVYNDEIDCFVFKGINNLFYGVKEILKKIHNEYPNDCFILDNLNKIEIFLKLVHNSINMDDLCDILNNNLNIYKK